VENQFPGEPVSRRASPVKNQSPEEPVPRGTSPPKNKSPEESFYVFGALKIVEAPRGLAADPCRLRYDGHSLQEGRGGKDRCLSPSSHVRILICQEVEG